MIWNDITEIRSELKKISSILASQSAQLLHLRVDLNTVSPIACDVLKDIQKFFEEMKEKLGSRDDENLIHEKLDDIREAKCDYERIHDKLNALLADERRLEKVQLAMTVGDKFDDYMKNVDKLNAMVNEIKGVSSMTRASLHSPQILDILSRVSNLEKSAAFSEKALKSILKAVRPPKKKKKVATVEALHPE